MSSIQDIAAARTVQNGGYARKLRLAQVRVCCDTPQEASVVDALALFGVVHADMPVTLANIWLAMQGPACSEGPARQWFP
jgi:hypothetical protein